jgi:hypothetical protein
MANVIEVEVDTPLNNSWHFLPLERTLRGRFDPRRGNPNVARDVQDEFASGIPGQRLGIDLETGDAIASDPELAAKITKRKMALPPAQEVFKVEKDNLATWWYWLKRGVESGIVKVLKGKLPDKMDGKVRKRFAVLDQKSEADKRGDKLLAILFGRMTPAERKAAEEFLEAE